MLVKLQLRIGFKPLCLVPHLCEGPREWVVDSLLAYPRDATLPPCVGLKFVAANRQFWFVAGNALGCSAGVSCMSKIGVACVQLAVVQCAYQGIKFIRAVRLVLRVG